MRKRGFALAFAAALCACAPAHAPVQMPAARASEVLNLFASGRGPADLCSRDGRALLRGAVRAYSTEMQRSGVAWPIIPDVAGDGENPTEVDVSVMIAVAAGFVRTNDFRGAARGFMNQLTFAEWPEIRALRLAAHEACSEVAALQLAAADFVMERLRYEEMIQRPRSGRGDAERLRRQSARLERAHERMRESAAIVAARLDAHRL
jgi:hypothetical protein